MLIWLSAPRSDSEMKSSPLICSPKRVQRWHSTQRSRSMRICAEMFTGFG